MKKAVILLSGGLDSATVLAMATAQGYACYALSFQYGQKHNVELQAAKVIAARWKVIEHHIATVDLAVFGGSALTDAEIGVPETATAKGAIPVTYVPARNTLMLSYALAWAEVLQADTLFIGVNAIDYSGYPDCRPAYIAAFEKMAQLATKRSIEEVPLQIQAPLLYLSKAEIIRQGIELGVDYSLTVTCYQADAQQRACGVCDACRLRKAGFVEAGVQDPTLYIAESIR